MNLMSINEVARQYGCSDKNIYKHIKAGNLKMYVKGFVTESEYRRFEKKYADQKKALV